MTKEQALESLIDDTIKEIVKMEFYVDFYKDEAKHHRHVGVDQAKESLEIHRKHLANLQNHLKLLETYQSKKFPK